MNNILYTKLLEIVTIENSIKFLVLYFFIIWISLLVWVYKDISNRTEKIWFQILSIFIILILTPVFGIFIYLIIRPSKTLFENYFEEVELNLDKLNMEISEKINSISNKKES